MEARTAFGSTDAWGAQTQQQVELPIKTIRALELPVAVAHRRAVPPQWLETPHVSLDKTRIKTETDRHVVKKRVGEKDVRLDWSLSTITLREGRRRLKTIFDPTGEGSFDPGFKERLIQRFLSAAEEDWQAHLNIQIAGGVGRLVSEVRTESLRLGREALPISSMKARLLTVDVTDGRALTLERAIGTHGFAAICSHIESELRTNPDPYLRSASLEQTISSSFALVPAASGKRVHVVVGLPNEDGPLMTTFTFAAPDSVLLALQ